MSIVVIPLKKKKKKQRQTIKKTKSIQSCVFLVVNVLVEEANTSN